MLKARVLYGLFTASIVLGAPAPEVPTDMDILNFALTLEHMESAFYSGALAKYGERDFVDDGLPDWVHGRFVQIAQHEAEHVKFLTTALGEKAVKPCQYSFPYDSPRSFAEMAMVFETVGSSAYLGSAKFLTDNADYLTAAGSILAVEARQASWITASVMKLQPWNGPFDVPLTASGAFSLASPFIKDCPATNAALPVKTFPALKLSSSSPVPGTQISIDLGTPTGARTSGPAYVAWLDGLQAVYTELSVDGKTTVPQSLRGTVYAAVVNEQQPPSDENMLSGFTVIQFPFDSRASGPEV
ncbi:hypothetical protein OH77DRAFT_1421864 [Trametes cingulata]|nr:hypothetical protein OH77DRAFT_1421864 [Trametes cingulata]